VFALPCPNPLFLFEDWPATFEGFAEVFELYEELFEEFAEAFELYEKLFEDFAEVFELCEELFEDFAAVFELDEEPFEGFAKPFELDAELFEEIWGALAKMCLKIHPACPMMPQNGTVAVRSASYFQRSASCPNSQRVEWQETAGMISKQVGLAACCGPSLGLVKG
jgi:hypothetical protein